MKKFLSLLLCLAMLLCSFAMAENMELKLSNLKLEANGESVFDLSGIDLCMRIAAGETDGTSGAQLAVDADGRNVLSLVMAVLDEDVVLTMTGISSAYSIDLETLASLIEVSGGMTVQANGGSADMSEEDQQKMIQLGGELVSLIVENTVALPDEEINGVKYSVVSVEVSAEQIAPLLAEMALIMDNYSFLLEDSGVESFTELFEILDLELSLSGKIYDSPNAGIVDVTLNISAMQRTEQALLNVYLEGSGDAEDEAHIYFVLSGEADGENFALSLNLDMGSCGNDWLPAEGIETIDILSMSDTQMEKLGREASAAFIMAISQMAAANESVAQLLVSMMS